MPGFFKGCGYSYFTSDNKYGNSFGFVRNGNGYGNGLCPDNGSGDGLGCGWCNGTGLRNQNNDEFKSLRGGCSITTFCKTNIWP